MLADEIHEITGVDTVEDKCVIVIEIYPGASRPYYGIQKSSPKSSPKDVNQTQQKIIEMISNNPKVTQRELAEELNLTIRAVKKSIKEMQEKGLLERVGGARGGYWRLEE